jgi:hypothetical protein
MFGAKRFHGNIKIIKVIRRTPRPVYELEDLNSTHIDGQFSQEELVPFESQNAQFTK